MRLHRGSGANEEPQFRCGRAWGRTWTGDSLGSPPGDLC